MTTESGSASAFAQLGAVALSTELWGRGWGGGSIALQLEQPKLSRLLSEYELYTTAVYIYTHTPHTHTSTMRSRLLLHATALLNPLLTTTFSLHSVFQLPSRVFLHELYSLRCLLALVNATQFIWNILSTPTFHSYLPQYSDKELPVLVTPRLYLVPLIYAHQCENMYQAIVSLPICLSVSPTPLLASFDWEA